MEKPEKTLRVAVRKFGPFESAVQKIWERYRQETGTKLSMEMVPLELHELYQSTIAEGGLKKGDWDVAIINTDWIYEAYTSSAIENLKPYLDKDPAEGFPEGWSPSLLSLQQFGNAITGLPFHDGPECLIYRKDLFEDKEEQQSFFEQSGKRLQPPQSWEDFQEIAEFFQRPEENLYGTAFAGFPDGHNTVFDFCLQLWTRGGKLTDEKGKIRIDTEAAHNGLLFYRQMLQNVNAVHPASPKFDSVQSGQAFERGEVAMMVNWFGFASVCEVSEDSRVKGKVDVALIPKGPSAISASLNVYYLYVMGSGSGMKEQAYGFIKHAVSKENDKLLTMEGGIGCRKSTWQDPEVNALIPYYHKLELLHQYAKALPQKSNWSQIAAIIDEVVLQAVNTKRPVKEILQEGQEKINSIS